MPPRTQLQTGMRRIDTLSTGDDIDTVTFVLDDKTILKKTAPPWNVELDFGSLPRMRTLVAVAHDVAELGAEGEAGVLGELVLHPEVDAGAQGEAVLVGTVHAQVGGGGGEGAAPEGQAARLVVRLPGRGVRCHWQQQPERQQQQEESGQPSLCR